MSKLQTIFATAAKHAASDAIIRGNCPVILRINGILYAQKQVSFTPREVDGVVASLLNDSQKRELRYRRSVDFSSTHGGVNMRLNICSTAQGLLLSIRFLPPQVPSIDELNLHPSLKELSKKRSGLVLICGATGSGKTSTVAALINEVNTTRAAHILTLEDPIEYRFGNKLSVVDQRELGTHFNNFEEAMVDAMRQLPDVIMVGELRDKDVINNTINLAESGHLVIGTLHAQNVESAIFRLQHSFPPEIQELVCLRLSWVLQAVIVQRLTRLPNMDFLVPHLSILRSNTGVRNTIREMRINQLPSFLEVRREENMYTFETYKEYVLDKQKNFYSPARLFHMKTKDATMEFYHSPLVNYTTAERAQAGETAAPVQPLPQPAEPVQAPRPAPDAPLKACDDDEKPEDVYSLDDVSDYKDIIRNLQSQD